MSTNMKIITLDRFLTQRRKQFPGEPGELARVIGQMGLVGKIISSYMRRAALRGLLGLTGRKNVQGEEVKKLDELGNDVFVRAFEYVDMVGALVSEELDKPVVLSPRDRPGAYVVLIDPIDGSSNLDVNGVIGSIFSIRSMTGSVEESVLLKGTEQIAAGYVMYGTSTMFVYTAGDGVNSFVLDDRIGEFVVDREGVTMPERGNIFCANLGNYGKWGNQAKEFSDSLIRDRNYSMRYSGALVADLHQILHRGGIYFYPEDEKRPQGKLRLLYECAPVAMIAEQAGGEATTGRTRVLELTPEGIHQRVPFAVGSRGEVRDYQAACRGI